MPKILIGNIKGPVGPAGPTGKTGPTGPVGPRGPLPPLANNFTTTQAGVAALDAAAGKQLKDGLNQVNSDMTSKNLAGTDLNDFKNFSKHLIGHGTGYASSVLHAPWTAAFVVEYIPYGESYGVQTAYSVQKMDGMYQSAKRTYDQGYGGWSAWEYTSFDIRRNTNLTEGIDFNQVGLTKSEDGSYSLHFYKDGLWITNI